MEDDSTSLRSDQALWPLLLIAMALGVFGYAMAYRGETSSAPSTPDYAPDVGASPSGTSVATGPLELAYRPGPSRTLQLQFLQREGPSSNSPISTRVDLKVHEERRKRPEERPGVRYRRTYQRTGIAIRSGESFVGPRIARQVESMVLGVESVVEVNRVGKRQGSEWTSVTNPEIRQTLRMLRHAHTLLLPRPRRGKINVDDRWKYRLDAEHLQSEYVETIDGTVRVRETLADVVRRDDRELALLERNLRVEASGRVRLAGADSAHPFDVSATGSGRAYFAIDAGAVVESRLEVKRTLTIDRDGSNPRTRTGHITWHLREQPTP